jgi:acetyl esterase/lipase
MRTETITASLDGGGTAPAPQIICTLPDDADHKGAGLIIFPGGGYGGLAEHEGQGYADFFAAAGIACFVVEYRLGSQGHRHPAMLEDGLAAVATVRRQAAAFGLDPARIGVMGSSAGGHLASHVLVDYEARQSDVSLRPDFGVLCYPVISFLQPHGHQGSRDNLLGPDADDALAASLSTDQGVTPDTPPCFLWHTAEDPGVPVENSLMFASALRQNGVPFELHIYERGAHGLGLNAPFSWGEDCLRWIGERG